MCPGLCHGEASSAVSLGNRSVPQVQGKGFSPLSREVANEWGHVSERRNVYNYSLAASIQLPSCPDCSQAYKLLLLLSSHPDLMNHVPPLRQIVGQVAPKEVRHHRHGCAQSGWLCPAQCIRAISAHTPSCRAPKTYQSNHHTSCTELRKYNSLKRLRRPPVISGHC